MSDVPKVEWREIIPFLPSALGALLGTRYARAQTYRERLLTWILSMATGYYVGAMVGEYFVLGHATTYGVMFGIGSLGQEVFAFVVAALREGVAHPSTTAGKWIDAVLGRRNAGMPANIDVQSRPEEGGPQP